MILFALFLACELILFPSLLFCLITASCFSLFLLSYCWVPVFLSSVSCHSSLLSSFGFIFYSSFSLGWPSLSSLTLFIPYSVMFLQFVPKTHLFFTAGKDKKIKQWDADKFEHIQTLEVNLFSITLIFWVKWINPRVFYTSKCWNSILTKAYSSPVNLIWRLTGPSSGGLVYEHQSKRRPPRHIIPRQITAPVGEDQGANHPWGGTGDGEMEDRVDAHTLTTHIVFVSLNGAVFILTGARGRVWGEHGQRRCACGEHSISHLYPYSFTLSCFKLPAFTYDN